MQFVRDGEPARRRLANSNSSPLAEVSVPWAIKETDFTLKSGDIWSARMYR
jgi:hypothetical protein